MNFKRVLIFLIILLFFTPWIVWYFSPEKELDVAIFNKTINGEDISYSEHEGITWALNHLKYTRSDGSTYNKEKDFYGIFPEENTLSYRPLPEDLAKKDLIYVADTYGVVETGDIDKEIENNSKYQGLNMNELEKIREAAYKGTTVISEYNSFASPTPPDVRAYMEEVLGVEWTGWIGRYFEDLSKTDKIPEKAFEIYEKEHGQKLQYEGRGILLLNEGKEELIILKDDDISKKGIKINFTPNNSYDRSDFTYKGWFDINKPKDNTSVMAQYVIGDIVSEKKKNKLEKFDIPKNFPAITLYDNSIYNAYYLAGNFSKLNSSPYQNIAGLPWLMDTFSGLFDFQDGFYWQKYLPLMRGVFEKGYFSKNDYEKKLEEMKSKKISKEYAPKMVSKIEDKHLETYFDGNWEDFFVKGVNLGIAKPGKWFTEFPEKESTYMRWFEKIGEMNANSIRVYTLMDPSFYRALLKYNLNNIEEPLWLFQNIWPEEHPEDNNLLGEDYMKDFRKEIEYAVDAIHGEGEIPKRQGRAYGDYYADVSPFTISYLVGREIETYEVLETNELNNINSYEGNYVEVEDARPAEVWLAKAMDYTMEYEETKYNWQRPTAFVSWPILDPIDHTNEWKEFAGDEGIFDAEASIDIRNLKRGNQLTAGIYGSYHIYPNYPGFINHSHRYSDYKDEKGTFRYGGYLEHFMEKHSDFPALVSEFGQATGMGKAHYSPDGYHHGGLTEEEQGKAIVRMMESIERENYMGGIVFEWMDEWAKKTWTTEPFIIPYEHNVFWHNAIDPEQNYGIMANEAIKPDKAHYKTGEENDNGSDTGEGNFEKVSFRGNEAYLYMDIKFNQNIDLDENNIILGIDTYDRDRGQFVFSCDNLDNKEIEFETGKEFLLKVKDKESSKLLVTPDYNIARGGYHSKARYTGEFEEIDQLINAKMIRTDGSVIEKVREDGSSLEYGEFEGTIKHWYKENKSEEKDKISLRIPWSRLNVTDPINYKVLHDDTLDDEGYVALERDQLEITETEGFVISGHLLNLKEKEIDDTFVTESFLWESWREPRYEERLKNSYYILQSYWD